MLPCAHTVLQDLFGAEGDLKKVTLNNGTATVVFVDPSQAVAALKKYNGVTLDGVCAGLSRHVCPLTRLQASPCVFSAPRPTSLAPRWLLPCSRLCLSSAIEHLSCSTVKVPFS